MKNALEADKNDERRLDSQAHQQKKGKKRKMVEEMSTVNRDNKKDMV